MNGGLFLFKMRMKNDGTYPISVYVNNCTRIIISTGLSCAEKDWDAATCTIRCQPDDTLTMRKNTLLQSMSLRLQKELLQLMEDQSYMDDDEMRLLIKRIVKGDAPEKLRQKRSVRKRVFLDYLDEFARLKDNVHTVGMYILTEKKIKAYDPSCTFETMTKGWLMKFEAHLKSEGCKTNGIGIHMRNIRAVFNYCLDEEYTTLYPFRKYKIRKEETRKRRLTPEQVRTLRDYPVEQYQEKYRDLFMLMLYMMGINASDLFEAKKTDVHDGRLEYRRNKTGKLFSVLIEPEAQAIIDKYAGEKYLLDVSEGCTNIKNFLHQMNDALKQIGEVKRVGLGGRKERQPLFPELTSYWSRHTWATIAAGIDIPKETIGRALGHSWACNTVTDIYIDYDEAKVDHANRAVIDYLNALAQ